MCLDWGSNPRPWHIGMTLQPTELPGQGLMCFLFLGNSNVKHFLGKIYATFSSDSVEGVVYLLITLLDGEIVCCCGNPVTIQRKKHFPL